MEILENSCAGLRVEVRDAAREGLTEDHAIALHSAAVKLPALALETGTVSGVRIRVSRTTWRAVLFVAGLKATFSAGSCYTSDLE